jgi:hypothetical protein
MNQLAQMINRNQVGGTTATKLLAACFVLLAALAVIPLVGLG